MTAIELTGHLCELGHTIFCDESPADTCRSGLLLVEYVPRCGNAIGMRW